MKSKPKYIESGDEYNVIHVPQFMDMLNICVNM